MKFKSLLLGSAALFLGTGVQAADVMAQDVADAGPVSTGCSVYGSQFFHIGGSTCLRVGGSAEMTANVLYYLQAGTDGKTGEIRKKPYVSFGGDAKIFADARRGTDLGPLRGYVELSGDFGSSANVKKAYVQFGGLTAGRSDSAFGYSGADEDVREDSDFNLIAYSVPFGDGIVATVSLEQSTAQAAGAYAPTLGGTPYRQFPDAVLDIEMAQSWGGVGVSGVAAMSAYDVPGVTDPKTHLGFAVSAGGHFNVPNIDSVKVYAAGYYGSAAGAHTWGSGTPDFLLKTGGEADPFTGWAVTGGVTGKVSPVVEAALWGAYTDIKHPGTYVYQTTEALAMASSSALDKKIQVGGSVSWDVVPDFSIGLEVVYAQPKHFWKDAAGAVQTVDVGGEVGTKLSIATSF